LSADSGTAMPPDAIFRIASMTKLVTAVAVMQLVDEGLVDLELPLAAYLPGYSQPPVLTHFDARSGRYETRPAARDATLRELLSHTGGFGYWFLDEPLRIASGPKPDLFDPPFLMSDPGERFAYSTSSDVVGLLVAPVAGLTLDDWFAQRIFEPLAMADTGFGLPADASRLTRVHRRTAGGFVTEPTELAGNPVRGGGGLYSTADDYLRLLRCLLNGGELDGVRILSEAAAGEIGRNQIGRLYAPVQRTALPARTNDFIFMDGTQRFGFGVMVESRDQPGRRRAGSFGWGGIVNTYCWVDPAADVAAVLMLQLSPFADAACVDLLRNFETAVYARLQPDQPRPARPPKPT
jgi:CubicO group peptidase (beta-lactamase class C family)